MTIDLGKKPEETSSACCDGPKKDANKKYYPTAYISGVKGLELSVGDTGTATFRVVGTSQRSGQEAASYDIEIVSVEEGGDGLDKALNKIAKKKMPMDSEEEDMAEGDAGEESDSDA